MVDQNPQVNQNVNNQNENDELFGGSDDIFENSDLLQPINTEVDTAHQVIKSQNDLNNFGGEIQSSQSEPIDNRINNTSEQSAQIQSQSFENDDLFEQPHIEQNIGDEHLNNLYDEEKVDETVTNTDDYGVNDDIFDNSKVKEDFQNIPEVVENVDESQADTESENLSQDNQKIENTTEIENNTTENIPNNDEDDNFQDDLETLDDIDEIDDIEEESGNNNGGELYNDNVESHNDEDENEINYTKNEALDASYNGENFNENNEDEKDDEDENEDEEDEDENENESTGISWNIDSDTDEKKESFSGFEEETEKTDEEEQETVTVQDYEKYDPNLFKTDVQKKFGELQRKTEKIHELVGKNQDVGFDLLGGNDDRKKIIYRILSGSDYVEIEKEELNKEDESTATNLLAFELEENLEQSMSLKIYVNDIELYDEIEDLQNDPNKKMQVLEKMNKFIFLLDEEYKKIQKYKKEKEERNAVKGVFRNF